MVDNTIIDLFEKSSNTRINSEVEKYFISILYQKIGRLYKKIHYYILKFKYFKYKLAMNK